MSIRIIAVSYRGYWKSAGRPSEAGIRQDSVAALEWVQKQYGCRSKTVVWGQSLGAAVAGSLAASKPGIDGLILETPFVSIKSMLVSLYPQRWLPYRYLWPFLRNSWDNVEALRAIAQQRQPPKILMITAERDEVVPSGHGAQLLELANDLQLDIRHVSAPRALHHEVLSRSEGRIAITRLFHEVAIGTKIQ